MSQWQTEGVGASKLDDVAWVQVLDDLRGLSVGKGTRKTNIQKKPMPHLEENFDGNVIYRGEFFEWWILQLF